MRMDLTGDFGEPSGLYYTGDPTASRLGMIEMASDVYSKAQARIEFERFLASTTLPEQTRKEMEQYEQQNVLDSGN